MQQIPILEGIQIKTLMFFILELSCPSSVIIRKANITKIKKQATRDDEPRCMNWRTLDLMYVLQWMVWSSRPVTYK
jgi:hypothetical protein